MSGVVLTALAVEAAALRGALGRGVRVHATGMGPARAAAAGRALLASSPRPDAVLLAGVAGGTGPGVAPGDLVVAAEVRSPGGGAVPLPSAPLLAGALRRSGRRTHLGPVATSPVIVGGAVRTALRDDGVLAVDMESAALAGALADGVRLAVVRAVVDTAEHPLLRPGTAARGVRALLALRRAGPVLADWLTSPRPRETPHAPPQEVS